MPGYCFLGTDGSVYLVRCPKCGLENYLPAVASGQCCWCGYIASIKDCREETCPTKTKTNKENSKPSG